MVIIYKVEREKYLTQTPSLHLNLVGEREDSKQKPFAKLARHQTIVFHMGDVKPGIFKVINQ